MAGRRGVRILAFIMMVFVCLSTLAGGDPAISTRLELR